GMHAAAANIIRCTLFVTISNSQYGQSVLHQYSLKGRTEKQNAAIFLSRLGYRKYKPPFCSSSEVSYLKFPHSFTAQAPILTAGPA
ncbi:hypothetical protein SPM76_24155, partial [Enterobacter hormaechei subsp. xiangfangensis]|nr:hypothetical protein [Klebsiella pneumoniae]